MGSLRSPFKLLLMMAAALLAAPGCGEESCLTSAEGCVMVSPCSELSFECSDRSVEVRQITEVGEGPGGWAALASPGDYLLTNSVVEAVIDGIDHQHFVAPSGGNLLDLATVGDDNDSLNLVFQGVGFLPRDTAKYEEARLIEGDGFVAIQVSGHLDELPDVHIHTRYELRACEPGIRVRTEIINRGPDPLVWVPVDAWYWSGKETLPFAPGLGTGFDQAGLIDPVADSFQPIPYIAAAAHTTHSAAYSCAPCNHNDLYGFQTEQLSANGTAPRVVQPRDYEVFERFIAVADGDSLAGATDIALEVRRQLFDEPWAELRGQLEGEGLGTEARATVHISQGSRSTPVAERIPWTQVTTGPDGAFSARVPADGDYVVEVESFGRKIRAYDVRVDANGGDVGTIEAPAVASLELRVTLDGDAIHAQVYVQPADDETREDVTGQILGGFLVCAPLLGSPYGPSPACNRVLVNGPVTVQLPPGRYDVYATAGPFTTIARETVDLGSGDAQTVELAIVRLQVQPENTLSADLHVHGSASFDASIPDDDRVRAFLAAGIDVIASTDHDVSNDYADAMSRLNAYDRMALMVGVETTSQILWNLTPGAELPQVIGHWNFWPLEYRPDSPYRGAAWDERAEPGLLMTWMERDTTWSHEIGVVQMNHPWDAPEFGRDLGYPRAVGLNALEPLPDQDDGTGQARVNRRPPDAAYANSDYDVQEVMNGTPNRLFLAYRAFWFYMLNQGYLRGGTANSDSHSMTDSVVATPRNLIWTDTTIADFDEDVINTDIRAGHMIGTNGPVIEIGLEDDSGVIRRPDVEPFQPASGASLAIRVTAAPWVPIEEVRIYVNGEVVEILIAELDHPEDPFGTDGLVRFEGEVELDPLLPASGDAWVVVEAGAPLADFGDLDCNGIPDTSDNNGDGLVDWRDVDWNEDDEVNQEDVEGRSEPSGCFEITGPLNGPTLPERDEEGYHFWAVTPDSYPLAFTNPLVLDLDGGGFTGPGRP
jgi:hypothetical protein